MGIEVIVGFGIFMYGEDFDKIFQSHDLVENLENEYDVKIHIDYDAEDDTIFITSNNYLVSGDGGEAEGIDVNELSKETYGLQNFVNMFFPGKEITLKMFTKRE